MGYHACLNRMPPRVNQTELRPLLLAELDAVHRLAMHMVRNGAVADDVVQETYLCALQGLHGFTLNDDLGVRPWLFRILHHVVIKRGVKDRRGRERDLEVGEQQPRVSDDVWSTSESQIDWERVDGRLKLAIDGLAEPLRSTFLLLAVGELSYKEIAAAMQVPIGTVMSRLSRARRQLMLSLGDLAQETGFRRTGLTDVTSNPRADSKIDA
jgi:RNA polymerase sigma-70 factor, ECF subfamily